MSEVRTNSITDAAGTGAPDFPNGINSAGNIGLEGTTPAIVFAETDTTDLDARVRLQGGDLLFETVTDANALVRENMRIADSGFVGIGTDTPNTPLDVEGAGTDVVGRFYRTDSTLAVLRVGNSTTGDGGTAPEFGADGTNAVIRNNNAERMRIDSSGNVLVGKTTSTGSRFEVERADNDNAIADFKTNNASGDLLIRSSGGYVRVRSTGTNEMAFLSAGTERMRIDSAGTLQFNSGYGSVAPAYGCRAWVNFNGTGTVAIRASGNVSSITDNGVGNYTVNFTTAMPDANFATVVSAMTADGLGGVRFNGAGATTTSSVKVYCTSDARAGADAALINVAVFR